MIQPDLQSELFKYKLNDGGCSTHQIDLLVKENLLSFTPEGRSEFEGYEIRELKFLKSLYFDSGLPTNVVLVMLGKLVKPYAYSFVKIYWDFGSQEWKELPPDVDRYIEDNLKDIIYNNLDYFLDNTDEDDVEYLEVTSEMIVNRLKKLM